MLTSVVTVADTRASAVDASLQALVPAVAQAEAAGSAVEIIIVDSPAGRTSLRSSAVSRAPG